MALLPSGSAKYKGILLVCGVALVAFALSTVYGTQGLLHLFQMRTDYVTLDRSVTQLQQDNVRLQDRVRRLESDNRYIEQVAREQLDLAKPGEMIYRLIPPTQVPNPR